MLKYEKLKELATTCKLNKTQAESIAEILDGLDFESLTYTERLGILELLELKKIKKLESISFKSKDDYSYLYLKCGNSAIQIYIKSRGTADICTSCKKMYRERLKELGCSFKGTADRPKTAVFRAVSIDNLSEMLREILKLFTDCEQ